MRTQISPLIPLWIIIKSTPPSSGSTTNSIKTELLFHQRGFASQKCCAPQRSIWPSYRGEVMEKLNKPPCERICWFGMNCRYRFLHCPFKHPHWIEKPNQKAIKPVDLGRNSKRLTQICQFRGAVKSASNETNSNSWNPLLSRRGKRAIGKIEATRRRDLPPKGQGKADSWVSDVGVLLTYDPLY